MENFFQGHNFEPGDFYLDKKYSVHSGFRHSHRACSAVISLNFDYVQMMIHC